MYVYNFYRYIMELRILHHLFDAANVKLEV